MIRLLTSSRALGALLAFSLLGSAAVGLGLRKQTPDIQRVTKCGNINWSKGVLSATGLGAINAEEPNYAKAYLRARNFAKLDALRNLLMVVDHVRIDSHTVGRDYEAVDDEIRAEIKGIVRGAQVVSEREIHIKGSTMIEVTVATAMYGDQGIASVFLPEEERRAQEEPRHEEPSVEVAPVAPPERPESVAPAPETDQPYTSVIIDTRGYNIERCMSPKILRQDGSEVWGTVQVDPDYVIEHGIVVYARNMEEARAIDRAGRNPLILHATARGTGRFPSDAILSDEEADRLMQIDARDHFLNKFRVIFIVDAPRPLPF